MIDANAIHADMQEIVGAKIGSIITNKIDVIIKALSQNNNIEWLTRVRMQFMSSADLGIRWDNMAKAPTIFLLDRDGNPHSLKNRK